MTTTNLNNLNLKPKSKRGGSRPNAGRKPEVALQELKKIKERIAAHGIQEVEITKAHGQKIKLTRIEALLDVLFDMGFKEKNLAAIKEYYDRQLGKAIQPIAGTGENNEIVVKILGYGDGKFQI